MLDLKEILLNQWVEFSGGSRPESNTLMFDDGEPPRFLVKYVFDWDTKDVVTLSFELDPGDFDCLVDELIEKGYSSLTKKDDKQELFFEWKLSEDRVLMRMDGQAYAGPEGKVRYLLSEFRDLIIS
jgi:hypothetical protein